MKLNLPQLEALAREASPKPITNENYRPYKNALEELASSGEAILTLISALKSAKEALLESEGVLLNFMRQHDANPYIAAEKTGDIIDKALSTLTDLVEF